MSAIPPVDVQAVPVLPDYGGACLDSVVPALSSAVGAGGRPGGRGTADPPRPVPDWVPGVAFQARQIVLLVVDGLGWHQLRARPALAPTLCGAEGIARPITSVVPTTTACALTSITTARPPADHGLLGYRLAMPGDEILNALHWTLGARPARDARRELPAHQVQPFDTFPGWEKPVPVVSRRGFGRTGFTAAHLGQSPLEEYAVPSTMVVTVHRLLARGAALVYAYYDGIDKVAHAHGLGAEYDAELANVDRIVTDLAEGLPSGAVLVVTADHGQVDVGPNVELLGADIMAGVRILSGEGRFRWLHARAGAADDVAEMASERYQGSTWVRTRDRLIDEGWFGGPPRPGTADRLGDVALVPHAPVAFIDPADPGETRLAARHGSLTPDEMHVPLVALARDGNI